MALLDRLSAEIKKKRPPIQKKKVLFHQDNEFPCNNFTVMKVHCIINYALYFYILKLKQEYVVYQVQEAQTSGINGGARETKESCLFNSKRYKNAQYVHYHVF